MTVSPSQSSQSRIPVSPAERSALMTSTPVSENSESKIRLRNSEKSERNRNRSILLKAAAAASQKINPELKDKVGQTSNLINDLWITIDKVDPSHNTKELKCFYCHGQIFLTSYDYWRGSVTSEKINLTEWILCIII